MNGTTEQQATTDEADQLEPVAITVGQLEEWMRYTKTTRAFIFAKYKGRWVDAVAEDHGDWVMYLFFKNPTTALMSECISGVSVPQKPTEL